MADYQQDWSKLLSLENRDSADSANSEANGRDEEFYEKIEAPKFVDFSIPDHYCPDDRYWFCLRVGCDHKHEEEMDSEEIYKKFVLRVMAARSPNVRLRKALDRNTSRTPIKCPLSAPPKSSKPRLSRMAIISSISKKFVDEKKSVVRPLLKNGSTTPLTKTRPVAAKYLTTPRNKNCVPNQNSFRSVQNPKPTNNIEVPKTRMVVKALAFHSPKKTVKVAKTSSVELRTPVSKLCEGMKKLEISSQKKLALGNSSKSSKNMSNSSSRRQLSSRTVQKRPDEAKFGKSIESKIKVKLSQQNASKKLLANDHTNDTESSDVKEQLAKKVAEGIVLQESTTQDADLTVLDDSRREENCSKIVECNNLRSQATDKDENNSSSDAGRNGHEFVDGDDKENVAASDNNRMHEKNLMQNGRKIFGLHDKSGQVKKKVTQTYDKNLKEGPISSGAVTKLKTTNPKPFRLRTDERGILKEANLEKRNDPLAAPQSETANLSTPCGKLQQRKHGNHDIQKGNTTILSVIKTPKKQERSAASPTAESDKQKPTSDALQRLEKFRKMNSPTLKNSVKKLQGLVSEKKKMVTFLIPGKKLDVINETSPKKDDNVTEPNIHNTPKSCIKKLK
ncbi:hypothetical protein ABFS82_02G049200 [Erythranthe guttata]|uniref:uncharacterized protein LOC105949622 n=1 Tax=Erythranthe guttata TaxID=4155 RepID=UPI00064D883A|nr:PREDICTED: uncharacterized protein LOC105949622 [Erythranthe guttata]|eukprot:XP_012828386.1 PREDICTED: uncharacterized protein LOC105949622 [Erythranthe guttata]